jgi:two-component system, OmpR family, sensor kinase
MNRLPIRVRLTLAFALAIAAVVAAGSLLLYDRQAASLDRTLDQSLHVRAVEVAALVKEADPGLGEAPPAPVGDATGSFAQVLDAHGTIHDQTRGLGEQPLIAGAAFRRAQRQPLLVTRVRRFGSDMRLLAVPVRGQEQRLVLVVGAPLRSRDQALASLRSELLIGGPFALVLASLIGYLVAGSALRPVERMRARAASITDHRLSERLPVPPARDEIARLGITLNQMLDRLERGVSRERSFVADASHELRTPLSLIRTEVELALDLPRSAPELESALRSIGEEADRLSQLTDDLLLLARFDEGQVPLRTDAVDTQALLEGVASRFRRRAKDAGRSIEVRADDTYVEGDRLRLEQAFANLVENALRHGSGMVTLKAFRRDGGTEIHVTDEGAGFAESVAASAFDRFARGDAARTRAGAGLGLAIVKAIVEAHGGNVRLGGTYETSGDVEVWLPDARVRDVAPTSRPEVKTGEVS